MFSNYDHLRLRKLKYMMKTQCKDINCYVPKEIAHPILKAFKTVSKEVMVKGDYNFKIIYYRDRNCTFKF